MPGSPRVLVAAGYKAIDSLRLEKGYRYWSSEISPDYTPLEAGLGFAVKLNKKDFIGKEAILKQKEAGLTRKLCCMTLSDSRTIALGKEPIRYERWQDYRMGGRGWIWLFRREKHHFCLPADGVCQGWHGTAGRIPWGTGRGCGGTVTLMGPQGRAHQSIISPDGCIMTLYTRKRFLQLDEIVDRKNRLNLESGILRR